MDTLARIKQLMNERNWTRYRLSKESGLSEETSTNIFKRGTLPSIATLQSICDGFQITLSQFFSESTMIECTQELKELFDEWRFLTPMQKKAILITMKAMKHNSNDDSSNVS